MASKPKTKPKTKPAEMVITPEDVDRCLREGAALFREFEHEFDRYFIMPMNVARLPLLGASHE